MRHARRQARAGHRRRERHRPGDRDGVRRGRRACGDRRSRADRSRSTRSSAAIAADGRRGLRVRRPTSPTKRRCWRSSRRRCQRLGGLDILVNNAGILIEKPLLETTAADFDRLIGVNLRGVFLVGREALRAMAAQSSRARHQHRLGACLSRPRELLDLLRLEGRRPLDDALLGARVRAAHPGQRDRARARPTRRCSAPNRPRRRRLRRNRRTRSAASARPEEIAAAAVFLAGPGATFMTGQCISPNGGAVMF